ncbi:MAG: SO_0444 family Cu/Zn efflux transporter, partial [Psychromonas sp.]
MLLENFIILFLDSAPWLLLGLILAGMLKMFVPMSWMQKQLGGHGFKTTVKAALLGAPLPLCSCGVIPAAVGLRRSGASKAATTSFLVSTPETGVDSIAISYVLLGPFMAIVRPIAAILSAITAGLLVGRDDPQQTVNSKVIKKTATDAKQSSVKSSSCCSTKKASSTCASSSEKQQEQNHNAQSSSCGASKDIAQELGNKSIAHRIVIGLHYAATDLVRDTTIWLLVGLFFAAIVQTYVPVDFMAKWGDGVLAMLVMVVISVPMYICATASTPIAAGLLLSGVAPGAVLVFMLAGPATNIATLGVVAKELGKRALFGYLGGVLGVALLSGVLVNYLVATFGFVVMPQVGEQHNLLP